MLQIMLFAVMLQLELSMGKGHQVHIAAASMLKLKLCYTTMALDVIQCAWRTCSRELLLIITIARCHVGTPSINTEKRNHL